MHEDHSVVQQCPTEIRERKYAKILELVRPFSCLGFLSDEKKLLYGLDGFSHYWRDLRIKRMFFSWRNIGGGSLIRWGCFGAMGNVGKAVKAFSLSRMDSAEYQRAFAFQLLPFLDDSVPQTWIFKISTHPLTLAAAFGSSWKQATSSYNYWVASI